MAVINLGRVGYVHKGAYAAATTYQKYDVVLYNHGSYLYIGDTASKGHTPTDTAYWQAMLDPNEMNAATEAAVNAADAAHASAMELAGQVDRLTTPFSITGDMVNCCPVSDYPLGVISHIEPVQEGSGDPSPSNIRPISGWTGAKIANVGQNFFPDADITIPEKGVRIKSEGGIFHAVVPDGAEVSSQSTAYAPYKLRIAGEKLVRLRISEFSHTVTNVAFYLTSRDGSMLLLSSNSNAAVEFYITDECRITPYIYNNTGAPGEVRCKMHLTIGDMPSASGFVPSKPQEFAEASFGQTIYGGELDWKTGMLKVTGVTLTFEGTEAWYSSVAGSVYFIPRISIGSEMQAMPNSNGQKLSSHYTNDRMSGADYLYFYDTVNGVDVDTWKAYLKTQYAAGTPVQIFYKLATPKEIQLTPQQILSLAGENSIWSDCGETTVNGPNSPKVMENRITALEAAIANMA